METTLESWSGAMSYAERYTDSTIRTYSSIIRNFEAACPSGLEKANSGDIEKFLSKENKRSKSTTQLYRSALSSFYEFLKKTGSVHENPVRNADIARWKNRQRTLPKLISQSVYEEFEHAISEDRYRCAFGMMRYAGLRVSEVASIEKKDFSPDESGYAWIRVREGKGGVWRDALVTDRGFVQFLAKYIEYCETERLISVLPETIRMTCYRIARRAGLENFGIHPHIFRHLYATELWNRNVPLELIQTLLGHKSIETTLIYTQIQPKKAIGYLKSFLASPAL